MKVTTDLHLDIKHFNCKLRNKMLILIVGAAVLIFMALMAMTWFETRALMVRELKQNSRTKVELASNYHQLVE